MRAYAIGTDEAGYGPNLGPLLISATVWQVADGVRGDGLYGLLREVVSPNAPRFSVAGALPLAIADSKALYQPGKGIGRLERGVLAALALLGKIPGDWESLWAQLAPGSAAERAALAWHRGYAPRVPLQADLDDIERVARPLADGLARAQVRLVGVRSLAVFPERFNQLLAEHGSKGTVLSRLTLGLVADLLRELPPAPVFVTCDKHGGRNRYQYALAEHFPDWLIEIYGEGRALSRYQFGPPERRVEFRFQAKGETALPTALASMASKYLRELAMGAFNAFWLAEVPGLRPTAGYPLDAKRFKQEITARQEALGIDDSVVWRRK